MIESKIYPALDLKKTISSNRWKGLWNLMAGLRITYFIAVISIAISALAKTLTYLIIRDFADNALAKGSNMPIYYFALAFVGLAFIEGVFTFVSGCLAALSTEKIILRLRNYLFDHIQRLPFRYHDKAQTGELIQRVSSDVDTIRLFLKDQAKEVGRISLLFGINFIALLALNVKLSLLSIIIIPFNLVLALIFFKKMGDIFEEYQKKEAILSTALQENLSGVQVVKAFARQEFEMDKFDKANNDLFMQGKRLVMMHAVYWPITDLFCIGQMLFSFYMGAMMTIQGEITLGTYLVFINLIGWIIWPMRNLGRLLADASRALVSYQRVAEIINEEQETLRNGKSPSVEMIKGDIAFNHVSFAYNNGTSVLNNVSFHAKPGQVIALVGPTGSGKTSVVRLLPRFYDYFEGNLTLDGNDLRDYAPYALRHYIGIVEQEPFLFSRSIRDNITYGVGHDVTDEEVETAAQAAAIHDVIRGMPNGYKTIVGERGVTLSGGQKQRVAIARALLKDPKILILDDSTSSVDTETEVVIQAALDKLMQGRTTFVIAHRIQTVMRADRILVLKEGQIIQEGTHHELVKENGLYQKIYGLQAKIDEEVKCEVSYTNGRFHSNGKTRE